MPPYKGLRDEQVWQLVSYIRACRTRQHRRALRVAPWRLRATWRPAKRCFSGAPGCASCHEINARGGVTGPDLSNAGRLTAATLRQKIVSPNDPLPPAPGARGGGGGRGGAPPVTLVVKMADGREVRGVRRNEDTFSAQIVDASGQLHLIDKLTHARRGRNRNR